jgi:hypothetical protein
METFFSLLEFIWLIWFVCLVGLVYLVYPGGLADQISMFCPFIPDF